MKASFSAVTGLPPYPQQGPVVPHATDELERGRGSYARRAWTDAHEALGADRAASLGAADLELLATSAYMLGRDDEYVSGLERAHHAYLDGGEELSDTLCVLDRHQPHPPRRDGPRERMGGPCPATRRTRRSRLRRAGLSAASAHVRARGSRRPRRRDRRRCRRRRDRRALRRRRPVRPRHSRSGHPPDQAGAGRRGTRAVGRGDAGGHRRRAVADRQRLRLLRRDHRLSGRVRGAPRSGMDRGPDEVVRAAARHGRLQRHVPGAPCRDHAAARCLARRAAGSAARPRRCARRDGEHRRRPASACTPASASCAASRRCRAANCRRGSR